jgi:hypothetical protein
VSLGDLLQKRTEEEEESADVPRIPTRQTAETDLVSLLGRSGDDLLDGLGDIGSSVADGVGDSSVGGGVGGGGPVTR